MARKKSDNLFEPDDSRRDYTGTEDGENGADILDDIFIFSDSDIPSGNLAQVNDDLDLNSFLDFEAETPDKAEMAETEASPEREPEPEDRGELPEENEAPQEEAPAEPAAAGKISFFAKLTPEKERFLELMKSKKENRTAENDEAAKPKPKQEAAALRTVRRETALSAESREISRRPKRSELLVHDSELEQLDYYDSEELPETRDYLPIRFRRYGKSGIGGGLMYAAFVICLSIVLACLGWMFASDVLALSKDEITASVVVIPYTPTEDDILNEDGEAVDEDGNVITCDVSQVAEALKDGEIIEFKFLFELFSKLSHAYYKIDPGTYTVSTALDYRALVTEMQTGSDSQEITRITFPEGYTMDQMFELLEENNICDTDELYDAAANHNYSYSWLEEDWYLEAEGDPTRLEGYLFPDTYDFYQGESGISAVNRFLLRFHGLLTQDMYQQAENQGITLHEAVIIASLIEKEAGANDDRGNFSSVIYNRLRNGWKLQLDSTINYINNTSTFNISYADLETDSPYNTYLYEGLPKGAICNPGLASLTAALQPNSTGYWYWYAFEGSTYFFTNSDEFNAFAAEHPY